MEANEMADTKIQTPAQAPATDAPAPAPASNGEAATSTGFDVAFLTSPIVTAQAKIVKEAAQPKNKRSDAQLALDKVTPQIHKAWLDAGKPAAFAKLPTVSYPVDPARVTRLKGMIRKATAEHGARPRFGSDVTITQEMIKEVPQLSDKHLGLTLVTFGVMDKASNAKAEKPAQK